MCHSDKCPHEDHMGTCTWDAPGGIWPAECSVNEPKLLTIEDEVIDDMAAQMRAYQDAIIYAFCIPTRVLYPTRGGPQWVQRVILALSALQKS